MTSTMSLESLRLESVAVNPKSASLKSESAVSSREMITVLISSLQHADKASADKMELMLTRLGQPAVPALLQGLKSPHSRVKSVCAMALVRIGQPVVSQLRDFYVNDPNRAETRWIVEFILTELGGQKLPAITREFATSGKVIPFSR